MRIYITKDGAVIADDEFKKRFPDAKADVVNGKLVLKNMYEICAGRGAYIGARLIGKGIYQRDDTRASIPSTFVVYNRSYEQTMSNNIPSLLESRGWSSTVDFTKPYAVAYFYKYMPPAVTSVFQTLDDTGHVANEFPYAARIYKLNGEGYYISNGSVFKCFNTEEEAREELAYISRHGTPDLGTDISIDPGLDDVFGDVDSGRGSCIKTLVMYPHNIDTALSVIDKLKSVGSIVIVGFELMDYEQREKALSIIEQLESAVGYYKNFCKISNRFGGIDIYVNENKYFHEVCAAFAPSLNGFSFRIYTDGYEYDVMHGDGHLNISVPDTLFEAMNYIWYAPDVADINGEQFYIYGAPTDDGNEIYFSKKKFQAAGVSAYIKVSDIESLASAWGLPVVTNADKKSILAYGFEDEVNAYIIEHFYDDTVELRMDGVSATSDYINVESKYTLTFLAFTHKSELSVNFSGFTYRNGKVYGGYPGLKEALRLLGASVEYHLNTHVGAQYEVSSFPALYVADTVGIVARLYSANVYYENGSDFPKVSEIWRDWTSSVHKEFLAHAINVDPVENALEIIAGNITENDIAIADTIADAEDIELLTNFAMLPKRLYDAYMSLDVESRKPDAQRIAESIKAFIGVHAYNREKRYFQLSRCHDTDVFDFTAYYKFARFGLNADNGSPFVIEVDENFNVSVLKNEHINTMVTYARASSEPCYAALKTYDGLLPNPSLYSGYTLIDKGNDWSISGKQVEVDGQQKMHYVVVYVDDSEHIKYHEYYDDSGAPPHGYETGIELTDEVRGDGNITYTFTKNGDSVEVTYMAVDDAGNDITDNFAVMQFLDIWLHKDTMNGVAQWQEG